MVKVGIIGGAGYTAGELLRLLVNHPHVEIGFINSQSHPGESVTSVHAGLEGECNLKFTAEAPLNDVDCVFMCSGHGASKKFWQEHQRPTDLLVIDLAQDFRDESEGYVYGLPEINAHRIAKSELVANPGCFATAIELALLPLAASGNLPKEVNVTGVTGSTGAGVKPGASTHFSWRSGNLSVYKAFNHQHLIEIKNTLKAVGCNEVDINFVPVRGDFPRGIFVIATMHTDLKVDEVKKLYADFYASARFTHFVESAINMKSVVNTSKALVAVEQYEDNLLITVAIDNLLKGASGQAVQNMNLMCGFDEAEGLHLKALAF